MSTIENMNKTSGWRLLLYTILGSWLAGNVAHGVAEIVHGPSNPLDVLAKGLENASKQDAKSAPTKTQGTGATSDERRRRNLDARKQAARRNRGVRQHYGPQNYEGYPAYPPNYPYGYGPGYPTSPLPGYGYPMPSMPTNAPTFFWYDDGQYQGIAQQFPDGSVWIVDEMGQPAQQANPAYLTPLSQQDLMTFTSGADDDFSMISSDKDAAEVAGISEGAFGALVADLESKYGPLPTEATPDSGGALVVGGHAAPWIAGIIAASVALGALVMHRRMAPTIKVEPTKPVKVEPALPAMPGITTPGPKGQDPLVQQAADALGSLMKQAQGK